MNTPIGIWAGIKGVGSTGLWSGGYLNRFSASGPAYQPETIAFLNAVGISDDGNTTIYGITGNAVWQGVDAFFVGIKADGVDLSKLYAYAYMGGDATTHAKEMLRPTDGAWNGTFTASPLQDEFGVTMQLVTQNMLTPFGSAGFLPEFANVIGYYRRTGLPNAGSRIDLVSFNSTTQRHALFSWAGSGVGLTALDAYQVAGRLSVLGGRIDDNIAGSVQNGSARELVRNEVSIATSAVTITGTQPTELFNLGNGNGVATLGNYSFLWFYQDAMTAAQMIAMQSRIHALQTVLNRQITY
jgi:hypothetical protein